MSRWRCILLAAALLLAVPLGCAAQQEQPAPDPRRESLRQAQRLDVEGKHSEARALFQKLIDTAPDPASRAAATRRLAMSYAYDGNCAKTIELEEQVIAYWATRREAEPQNAHYQEGEMANEAARVCIDAGYLDKAERMYRRGSDLGNAEPEPRTHPRSLWDFRLAHALARIAARRGHADEAQRRVAEARRALESDPKMAEDQAQYLPYLVGYVALYTNDLATAETSSRTPRRRCAGTVPGGVARHDVRKDGRAGKGERALPAGVRHGDRKQPAERALARVHEEEAGITVIGGRASIE